MKRATKERETEAERAKARILAETRQYWISLGMIREEDAHLLETVEGPYHPRIERSREEDARGFKMCHALTVVEEAYCRP